MTIAYCTYQNRVAATIKLQNSIRTFISFVLGSNIRSFRRYYKAHGLPRLTDRGSRRIIYYFMSYFERSYCQIIVSG